MSVRQTLLWLSAFSEPPNRIGRVLERGKRGIGVTCTSKYSAGIIHLIDQCHNFIIPQKSTFHSILGDAAFNALVIELNR
jgi:hypothetical protein